MTKRVIIIGWNEVLASEVQGNNTMEKNQSPASPVTMITQNDDSMRNI